MNIMFYTVLYCEDTVDEELVIYSTSTLHHILFVKHLVTPKQSILGIRTK